MKTVECRQYPLPEKLLNKPILLIGTTGIDAVATLGDTTEAGSKAGCILGWVSFSGCITYECLQEFNLDQARHLIEASSAYSWSDGELRAALFIFISYHPLAFSYTEHSEYGLLNYLTKILNLSIPFLSAGDQVLYGWVVGEYGKFAQADKPLPALERLHRSLHKVV